MLACVCHRDRTPPNGYELTHGAAMAAFAEELTRVRITHAGRKALAEAKR
jgi:hypothetical protein